MTAPLLVAALPTPILIDSGPSPAGWHRLEQAMRCLQLYSYNKVLGLQLGPADALMRGSLGHVGLAHLYARLREEQQGGDREKYHDPITAMRLAAEKLAIEFKSTFPQELLAGGYTEMIPEYAVQHHLEANQLKILHVEEVFEARIGPYRYTARLDLVVEDAAGRVYVIDHKTAANPDSRTISRYSMSGQILGLHYFGQANWPDRFAGVKLNFISGVKPPSFKFIRHAPLPAPWMLRAFPRIVVDAEEKIAALVASGRDPWDWPKAASDLVCVHSYGKCAGYELCQWGPQQ